MSQRKNAVLIGGSLILGLGSFLYTTNDMDARTNQQLAKMRLEKELNGGAGMKGTESTKIALQKMLDDLPNKTTRQKLEDAVDAAHRTHGIGFRNSPLDPVDVGLPTSFTRVPAESMAIEDNGFPSEVAMNSKEKS